VTRIAKLYARFAAGGELSFAEFETLLRAFGFLLDRTRGSHRIYKRAGITDRVTIQPQGKAAKAYQVRQFHDIVVLHGLEIIAKDTE